MKMRKTVLVLVFAAAALTNCTQKSVQDYHEEVMAIHDEVMPKMGEIMHLKSTLEDRVEALQAERKTGTELANLKVGLKSLEKADKVMMDWMHKYKKPEADVDQQEAISYLLKEKEKIIRVKTQMLESISLAETLTGKENKE